MRLYLLVLPLVAIIACVNGSQPNLGSSPSRSPNVITPDEISAAHASTAYEAIERTHPRFLTSRIGLAPLAEREVYINGVRVGGIDALRGIAAASVREIRFVRAEEVASTSVTSSAPAILVVIKSDP
jgi:hypothetical protein